MKRPRFAKVNNRYMVCYTCLKKVFRDSASSALHCKRHHPTREMVEHGPRWAAFSISEFRKEKL